MTGNEVSGDSSPSAWIQFTPLKTGGGGKTKNVEGSGEQESLENAADSEKSPQGTTPNARNPSSNTMDGVLFLGQPLKLKKAVSALKSENSDKLENENRSSNILSTAKQIMNVLTSDKNLKSKFGPFRAIAAFFSNSNELKVSTDVLKGFFKDIGQEKIAETIKDNPPKTNRELRTILRNNNKFLDSLNKKLSTHKLSISRFEGASINLGTGKIVSKDYWKQEAVDKLREGFDPLSGRLLGIDSIHTKMIEAVDSLLGNNKLTEEEAKELIDLYNEAKKEVLHDINKKSQEMLKKLRKSPESGKTVVPTQNQWEQLTVKDRLIFQQFQ